MGNYTPPAGGGSSGSGLLPANNLSDLTNVSTARTNLGLGSMALRGSGEYLAASNNLSDLNNTATSRTNLGLTNMAIWNVVPPASGGTGLTALGTANYVLGMNSAGTGFEYKRLAAGPGMTITQGSTNTYSVINTWTSGTGKPYDLSQSNQFYTVLTSGNYALSVVSGTPGQVFRLFLVQDNTGNRTPAWWSGIKWPSATAPTQSSGHLS